MNVPLNERQIVTYKAHLPDFVSRVSYFQQMLSEDEVKKASHFHFSKHKIRYILSQGILRFLLGKYFLDQSFESIAFSKAAYGKPFVANSDIRFNISHSKDYAFYAFSFFEVGIDVEFWRKRKYLSGIINTNFSPLEQKIYHAQPKEAKLASFYQGWSANEAFIKAIGMGLRFPLKSFSVQMDPGFDSALLEIEDSYPFDSPWYLFDLKPQLIILQYLPRKSKHQKLLRNP